MCKSHSDVMPCEQSEATFYVTLSPSYNPEQCK